MKSMLEQNFGYAGLPDNIQRSTFNKPYRYKGTFDCDYLIPFFRQDYYPGDEFSVSATMYARLITPIYPIMDDIMLETFYFEVPYRLLWENWRYFFGEVKDPISNPTSPSDYVCPVMDTTSQFGFDTLFDHLGVPPNQTDILVDAFYSRAYNLIWNEWFRDQDLQDSVNVDIDDGPDDPADYPLQKINKVHDYFTSCRPWPQKFDEVLVPLGGYAPVIGDGTAIGLSDEYAGDPWSYGMQVGTVGGVSDFHAISQSFNVSLPATGTASGPSAGHANQVLGLSQDSTNSGVIADLSNATAASINDLREAFALQRMQELMARTGSRYTEQVFALFRVKSPDARQQRPVYLGGSKQYINVHENRTNTASNVDANGDVDTMNISGYLDVVERNGFRAAFTEHGIILGLCAVRGSLSYQQGIPRWMTYQTRDEFYAPPLAHLGEQPVLNREIFADGSANDELVFGYQERWAERRSNHSVIAGQFRSDHATPLDAWHLAQDYATLPTLNSDFVESDLSDILTRVTAVPSQPDIMMDAYFRIKYTTQMPVHSVPGLLDHF